MIVFEKFISTCKWLLTCAMLNPFRFIIWRTILGVAPVNSYTSTIITSQREKERSKKEKKTIFVLCGPPSRWTARTKERWRSGVQRRRGMLDRTYCLTLLLLVTCWSSSSTDDSSSLYFSTASSLFRSSHMAHFSREDVPSMSLRRASFLNQHTICV